MEPDVSPGFRRREEDGRAGGRDRFMSSVSAVVPSFRPQRTPRARTYPTMAGTTVRVTDGPMLVLVWVNVRPGGLTQGAVAARRVASRPAFKRVWPSSVGYVNAERTLTPCCRWRIPAIVATRAT